MLASSAVPQGISISGPAPLPLALVVSRLPALLRLLLGPARRVAQQRRSGVPLATSGLPVLALPAPGTWRYLHGHASNALPCHNCVLPRPLPLPTATICYLPSAHPEPPQPALFVWLSPISYHAHTHTHTFSPPTRDATRRCRPSNHPLCRVTAPSPSIPAPINGLCGRRAY